MTLKFGRKGLGRFDSRVEDRIPITALQLRDLSKMFSGFKQRNPQIPTRSPIQRGFRWLNHQVHQRSRLYCKPIHLVIHPNCL